VARRRRSRRWRSASALARRELDDVADEARSVGESISDDPERVELVRQRRALLHDLRRKYGDTLEEVIAFARRAGEELAELESHDERAAALDAERAAALAELASAAAEVGAARRGGAAAMGPRWRRCCASSPCPAPWSRSRSGRRPG
jgi:DNA repair protein RecN (Recombination protein N)